MESWNHANLRRKIDDKKNNKQLLELIDFSPQELLLQTSLTRDSSRVGAGMPKHTVDGRNPAQPGTYKTLQIVEYLPYQLLQDFFHQPYVKRIIVVLAHALAHLLSYFLFVWLMVKRILYILGVETGNMGTLTNGQVC